MPIPTIEQLLEAGKARGLPPERIAAGVRIWQNDMVSRGRDQFAAEFPDRYWKGVSALDEDVTAALSGLGAQAGWLEAAKQFPDLAERTKFLNAVDISGGDPDRMVAPPEWKDAARRVAAAGALPAFQPPGVQMGSIGQGSTALAVYEIRPVPDGSGYEAFVRPKGEDGKPGKPLVVPISGDRQAIRDRTAKELGGLQTELADSGFAGGDQIDLTTALLPAEGQASAQQARLAQRADLERRIAARKTRLEVADKGDLSSLLHLELDGKLRTDRTFLDQLPQHTLEQFTTRPLASVARSLAQATAGATGIGREALTSGGQEAVDLQTPGHVRSRFAAGDDNSVSDMISQGIESAITMAGPALLARGGGALLARTGSAARGMMARETMRGADVVGKAPWAAMYGTSYGSNYAQAMQEADALQATDPQRAAHIRSLSQLSSLASAVIEVATERIFPDEAKLLRGQRLPWREIATIPLKEAAEEYVGAIAQNTVNVGTGQSLQDPMQAVEGGFWGSLPFIGGHAALRALPVRTAPVPAATPAPEAPAAGPDASLFPGGGPAESVAAPVDPGPVPDAGGTAPAEALAQPPAFDPLPPEGDSRTAAPPLLGAPPPAAAVATPAELAAAGGEGGPQAPPLTPATEQDPTGTVPETPATLAEQRRRVVNGQRDAMLFPGITPDQVPREFQPGQNDDLILTATPAGTFLHLFSIGSEEVQQAVAEGRTGQLLGMGTDAKPEGSTAAIVQRAADGTEVTAAAVTPETAGATVAALNNAASPGDTLSLETPQQVIAGRLTGTAPVAVAQLPGAAASSGTEKLNMPPPAATPENVEGDRINARWTAFAPETGTLAIPRAEMPQIQSDHRGALVNFLNARGVTHERQEVRPDSLKPTQAEYSPGKVERARGYEGTPRAILVSSDNHVVDGHHQWVAALDHPSRPMPVMRLNAPIRELLPLVNEFPSATQTGGGAARQDAGPGTTTGAEVSPVEQWADRTIAEGRGRLYTGIDPALLAAYAVKGSYLVARGVKDFAAWSSQMVREFGEAVRPYLPKAWAQANGVEEPALTDSPVPSVPDALPVNLFGQRVQADSRLRESFRATFVPGEYEPYNEEGLIRRMQQWVGREGGLEGAARLALSLDSGLLEYERSALMQVVALGLDQRARRSERSGDAAATARAEELMDNVLEGLEVLASRAGQALRSLAIWGRLSSRGIVRHIQRQTAQARTRHAATTLPLTPEKAVGEVDKVVDDATREEAAERARRTPDLAQRWIDRLATSQSDTLSWKTPKALSALEKLIRAHMAEPNPAFQSDAQALGVPEGKARVLDRLVLEEHRRAEAIARESEERARASAQEARRQEAPNTARRWMDRLATSQSDTLAWKTPKAPGEMENLIRAHMEEINPDFAAQATALGVPAHEAAALDRMVLEEHRRTEGIARAKEAERQRREEEERPREAPNTAARWINRLAASQSDTLAWGTPATLSATEQLIREHMKAANPDFAAQATALGVPAHEAAALDRLVLEEHRRSAALAREKARQKLIDRLTLPKTPRAVRENIPPLVKALLDAKAAGALTTGAFLDAYSSAFGLPRFTPAFAAEIRSMAATVEAMPKGGWLQSRAKTSLLARLAHFQGVPVSSLATSFWYANVLSGPDTQAVNVKGNAEHLLLKTLASGLASHPRHWIPFMYGMLGYGAPEGLRQGWAHLAHGDPVMKGESKWQGQNTLEMMWDNDPRNFMEKIHRYGAASWGRYVFRLLSAADGVFFHTAKEGRLWLETSRALQPGQDVKTALGYDQQGWTAAQEQAAGELRDAGITTPGTREVDRRAFEIVESRQPPERIAAARKWAEEITFNRQPNGTMGLIAGAINGALSGIEQKIPVAPGSGPLVRGLNKVTDASRLALRLGVIPFVNIASNMVDTGLDYSPVGYVRAALGKHIFNHNGPLLTNMERREKAIGTTMAMLVYATLGAFAWKHADDDDATIPFWIYDGGPEDKNQRAQMPRNWKGFTFKIGDHYIPYSETVLGVPLAALAGVLNRERRRRRAALDAGKTPPSTDMLDWDEGMKRAGAVLSSSSQSLMRTGVLSSMEKLFSAMDGKSKPEQILFRTASGFVPAQGALRSVAKMMDPTTVDTSTFQGTLLSVLPVLRSKGQPTLNVFGDNVREPGEDFWGRLASRFMTTQDKSDADAYWLSSQGLHITALNDEIQLTDYSLKNAGAAYTALRGLGITGLEASRTVRAMSLKAIHEGTLTPEQKTQFARASGQLIRNAVRQTRRELATGSFKPKNRDDIQERLSSKVTAARRIARAQLIK